jgi:hypothetical protein
MAAITPIDPSGALPQPPAREQKGGRAAAEFGGAITHREMVQEKLRVDPAALADKRRAARAARRDDDPPPPPRESIRAARFAEDEAAADAAHDERMGQYVDIEA